ncbi:MAG: hypothetical protein KF721_09890 [Ignavibacteriaceae bacterium]|nr:hypothetical protein [Ignavibacteriaceae bacterium]
MITVKTHWRLAFRSVLKALSVTGQTLSAVCRAHVYRLRKFNYLKKQRIIFELLDPIPIKKTSIKV